MTTFEYAGMRYYIAGILDGFSRKLLALKVFKDAPRTRDLARLVRAMAKTYGNPRFLVTDHDCQFRKQFIEAMKGITEVVKGNHKRSAQFNGKIERHFRTLKKWWRAQDFPRQRNLLQTRLDSFRDWYNTKRPMHHLDCRTPEQIWSGVEIPELNVYRANDPMQPVFKVTRHNFAKDWHLPVIQIETIGRVRRSA